jgi:hypothetical protein
VTSDALSSFSTLVNVVGTGYRELAVLPELYSDMAIATNSRQTFSVVENRFSSFNARGVANTEWYLWENTQRSSNPVNGTVQLGTAGTARIYARDPVSSQWALSEVIVATTTEPSVEVTPAVSTVARGGVVQLSATVSTGVGVRWDVVPGTGTVNSSGTYTAPQTPGVYVVQATPAGGNGSRFGLATIIVQ